MYSLLLINSSEYYISTIEGQNIKLIVGLCASFKLHILRAMVIVMPGFVTIYRHKRKYRAYVTSSKSSQNFTVMISDIENLTNSQP